ncbi:MAG TPA: aminotransferase class I/II-fold pyridoxal phosphate-dependent enzyme, partial [Thermomicrobiaceae bacterium]|nr:aminotransferase class I/II-fold pyridoxal phosphate-dependent enzyme [Thermomicrobiaceae bacterium]
MKRDSEAMGPGTRAVWAGEDEYLVAGATQVPVVHSVSFGYDDLDTWTDVAQGRRPGHIYGRNTNPTVAAFEEKVRALEGGEAATSFATGMAAISSTLFTLLSPGDRVVSIKDTYGGTNKIFLEFLPRFGIDVRLCDTTDVDAIEAAVAGGCGVLYLETPTNPTLKVVDIAHLSAVAHEVGAVTVVDNTFATPINQSPLALGADLVVHSATKFLGGHADALGGVICGRADLVRAIYHFREINGATLDPTAAYLLLRGMKTLHLRV